jgi:transposase InsO family protein
MQSRQTTDVVLQALLMAVWRRKPRSTVLVHSDQGSQFTSMDWAAFLRAHNLEHVRTVVQRVSDDQRRLAAKGKDAAFVAHMTAELISQAFEIKNAV